MGSYGELLREPSLRRIIWGTLPGRLGYAMVGLAVFFNARAITHSLSIAGLATGAYMLTSSGTAGVRGGAIDRFGQTKPLMILAPLYAGMLTTLAFAHLGSVATILLSGATGFVCPPINLSARPLYRVAVGPELLRTAFAFDAVANNTTMVLGPAVSTFLALQVSPRACLLTVAAFMAIGGYSLLSSPLSRQWTPEPKVKGESMWRTPGIWVLAVEGMCAGFGFGAIDVAIPSAATLAHHPGRAGWLVACFAVGNTVGGFWAGAKATKIDARRGFLASAIGSAVVLLPLSFTHPDLGMGAVIFAAGCTAGPAQVFLIELLDRVRPPGVAVSAQGWLWALEGAAASAGAALAGSAAQHLGSHHSLLLINLGTLLSPIVFFLGRRLLVPHAARQQLDLTPTPA